MSFHEKKDISTRDTDLIYDFKSGDRSAFDVLVEKYQFKIFRIINRYVHDISESTDLTQEVFIRAFQSMDKFRGDSSFYTWLYRIAVNTAKNYLMLKSREGGINNTVRYLPEAEGRETRGETNTPEDMLISHETEHQFLDILKHLPAELRTAIMLRDQEGRSYEEIATIMDCPIGTVRSRIFRARIAITRGMDGDSLG
jgi:RNA polymerase sigma-70 factor (ECF subfamily)